MPTASFAIACFASEFVSVRILTKSHAENLSIFDGGIIGKGERGRFLETFARRTTTAERIGRLVGRKIIMAIIH